MRRILHLVLAFVTMIANSSLAYAHDRSAADKCAMLSAQAFEDGGWKAKKNASYEVHYSSGTKHCYLLITQKGMSEAGHYEIYKSLEELFEGGELANYSFSTAPRSVPHYKPAAPCNVTLPSGEAKICYGEEEFDAVVKQYMRVK